MALAVVLDDEAADWVANLYSEQGRELGNAGLFLEALREIFEDYTRAQRAEETCWRYGKEAGQPWTAFLNSNSCLVNCGICQNSCWCTNLRQASTARCARPVFTRAYLPTWVPGTKQLWNWRWSYMTIGQKGKCP